MFDNGGRAFSVIGYDGFGGSKEEHSSYVLSLFDGRETVPQSAVIRGTAYTYITVDLHGIGGSSFEIGFRI